MRVLADTLEALDPEVIARVAALLGLAHARYRRDLPLARASRVVKTCLTVNKPRLFFLSPLLHAKSRR